MTDDVKWFGVAVRAIMFTEENAAAVNGFIGDDGHANNGPSFVTIFTPEGDRYASPGDWIVESPEGDFYPCKPDVFEARYTEMPDAESGVQS